MEDSHFEAFEAIQIFVEDLWDVFGSRETPKLALYKRLIEQTEIKDMDRVKVVVDGFISFLSSYEKIILDEGYESIPKDVVIRYADSDTICISIGDFISESDDDIKLAIRQHLVTIGAILDPSDEKYDELEKKLSDIGIDDGTAEGSFISGIMTEAKATMEDTDMDNPGAAMVGLLSSGVIGKMVTGLQAGVGSGEMDVGKLLGSMQAAMGALMPTDNSDNGPTIEEVEDEKS